MGRAWRIEYKGALYHVLSRGNEQRNIFHDNTDRGRLLDNIEEMSERFAVDIFAYVLMRNHCLFNLAGRVANQRKDRCHF